MDDSSPAGWLIGRAAEGMASVIKGCSQLLAPVRSAPIASASGQPSVKGINHFGFGIAECWAEELGQRKTTELTEALVDLANLPVSDCRAGAESAIDRVVTEVSAEDRRVAVEYLSAVPFAVRRALVPSPSTGKLTLAPTIVPTNLRSLLGLLPVDVPPYPVGTLIEGTSYRLEELLGVGGFGAVYKATNRFEQNQPPRAIKFCLDPSMTTSLHREQAILDRLTRAGETTWSNRIVRLYGYALDVQPPFLVYEFVPGGDLTAYLAGTRQKTGRGFHPILVLELIRQIAEGLAFAHSLSLVHRDLKPANILVSASTIKLTDFGIGGAITTQFARGNSVSGTAMSQTSVSEEASLLRGSGTPLYMSAEQRRGEQPDPRHDLFSLGVVWYQLLAGDVTRELHPGWDDELQEEFHTPPGHLALIQRCVGYIKKRPADAGELLAMLPPPESRGHAATAMPSHGSARVPAAAARREHAQNARGTATQSAVEAELTRLKAFLADQIERDDFTQARTTVDAILRLNPADTEARAARAFLNERGGSDPGKQLLPLGEHQGWVRGIALTPSGNHALSCGDDGVIRLWDVEKAALRVRLEGHTKPIMSVVVGVDGRRALSGGWDGTVRFWDIYAGQTLHCIKGPWRAVKSVALAPDCFRALFAVDDHSLRLWNLETGHEMQRFVGHTDLVQSVAIFADGQRAVSGSDDGTVRLWSLETGLEIRCLTGHNDTVTSVAVAPNGRWILSGSTDRTLRLWDSESGRELKRLTGHTNWVNAVTIAADGLRILSASGGQLVDGRFVDGSDTSVRLWDVVAGKEMCRCQGHAASATCVALARNGRFAVSGGLDKTVRRWSLPR